jgi:type II secretory pathway pseudopilin PulG
MSRLDSEQGETLVELLITMVVIAIGLVAIVGELGATIVASDAHSSMAQAEVIVRDYADVVKNKASAPVALTSYQRCPTASTFKPTTSGPTPEFTVPNHWQVDIVKIEYWLPDNSNFPNGTFENTTATTSVGGTAPGGSWTQTDCNNYMLTVCALGTGQTLSSCDPRFDPGLWRLTLRAWNDRTDYGKEDFRSTILVRRGNRA